MNPSVNAAFSRHLVASWAELGLSDAVIAPGSRSTPLALAFVRDPRIRVHVFVDERSASFFALGLGRATGRPAAVLCTSGTATAHFHAAVLEAHHGRVPLLVCTADRPLELHGVGAAQTIDQGHLYGGAVRAFEDPGPPDDLHGADGADGTAVWSALARRTFAAAIGSSGPPGPGPVHCNFAFREPLVPDAIPPEPPPAVPRDHQVPVPEALDPTAPDLVVDGGGRALVVAGWGAHRDLAILPTGVPVLADPLSNFRGPGVVGAYDALLRVPDLAASLRPDVIVRVGGPMTSRVVMEWMDPSIPQIVVDPDRARLDPYRSAERFVDRRVGTIGWTEPIDEDYRRRWLSLEAAARAALDRELDARSRPDDGRIARDVAARVPTGGALLVNSSMPVRDLDSFMAPRTGIDCFANRGVNGIDGFVSTALGLAAGRGTPVVALTGDLGFLHDSNGLLDAAARDVTVVFVVVDNRGGGIFSFLPQADRSRVRDEEFETLFGTPVGVDVAALVAAHGVAVDRVDRSAQLAPVLDAALGAGGVRVVVVPTDRRVSVERHEQAWAAVARAVGRAPEST